MGQGGQGVIRKEERKETLVTRHLNVKNMTHNAQFLVNVINMTFSYKYDVIHIGTSPDREHRTFFRLFHHNCDIYMYLKNCPFFL